MTQTSGTTWTFPGYDSVETWATSWAERTVRSNVAAKAVEYGIATTAELQAVADGLRAWGRLPLAFFSIGHVEVPSSYLSARRISSSCAAQSFW